MFFFLELPLFIILCLLSFYVPGELLLGFLKISLTRIERFILSWFMGICLFLLFNYFFAWINLSFGYLFILVFLNLIFFYRLIKNPPEIKIENIDYWSLLILILGSVALSFTMFFSGMITQNGMQFIGTNAVDGIRHVAYIKNMINFFPPQHPGLSGMQLKGFHYFYDFMLSRFALFFHFGVEDLYFRLFPIILALLYGAGFYLLAKRVTNRVVSVRLILLLAYFGRSFSFPANLFFKSIVLIDPPSIVQPLGLMVNPFIVLSIAMLTVGLSFLPDIKKSCKYGIIVGLLLGLLCQVKVYTGLIGISAVCFYTLYLFIRYRTKYLITSLITIFLVAILTAVTFLPNNLGQGGFIFAPFAFYTHYISSSGFTNFHFDLKMAIFAQYNNYLRIAILFAQAIGIFWFLNLGLRLVIIFKTREIFRKRFWLNDYNFILFLAFLTLILIGSFFIQTVSVFDTVQFFWIILALLAVPSGIVFGEIFSRLKKFKYFLIILILALSIPGNFIFLRSYLPSSKDTVISNANLSVYKKIQQTLKPNEILIYISKKDPVTLTLKQSVAPTVAAMTGRSVYLNYGNLPSNLDNVYIKRTEDMLQLDNHLARCDINDIRSIMKKFGTNYLLTTNNYLTCLDRPYMATEIANSNTLHFYLIKK